MFDEQVSTYIWSCGMFYLPLDKVILQLQEKYCLWGTILLQAETKSSQGPIEMILSLAFALCANYEVKETDDLTEEDMKWRYESLSTSLLRGDMNG